jgi:hypothetical protein
MSRPRGRKPAPRGWQLAGLAVLSMAAVTCGTLLQRSFDRDYGQENPDTFDRRPVPAPGAVSFARQVRPLLERRCVVCHACYDAPCQLKLTSWDGIARGASKEPVYASRLRAARPTRLYEDAAEASGWRKLGFFPVLNERTQTPAVNLGASLFYQLLAQKRRHPTPGNGLLPPSFAFAIGAERKCPRAEEHAGYEKDHPYWGMPYGLPAIDQGVARTLAGRGGAGRARARVAPGHRGPGPALGDLPQR